MPVSRPSLGFIEHLSIPIRIQACKQYLLCGQGKHILEYYDVTIAFVRVAVSMLQVVAMLLSLLKICPLCHDAIFHRADCIVVAFVSAAAGVWGLSGCSVFHGVGLRVVGILLRISPGCGSVPQQYLVQGASCKWMT